MILFSSNRQRRWVQFSLLSRIFSCTLKKFLTIPLYYHCEICPLMCILRLFLKNFFWHLTSAFIAVLSMTHWLLLGNARTTSIMAFPPRVFSLRGKQIIFVLIILYTFAIYVLSKVNTHIQSFSSPTVKYQHKFFVMMLVVEEPLLRTVIVFILVIIIVIIKLIL